MKLTVHYTYLLQIVLASVLLAQYKNAFINKAKFSDIKKIICIWKTLGFIFMK